MTQSKDFAPLPTYKESTRSNETWVAFFLSKQDSDGSTTQVSTIVAKAK